MPQQPDPFAEFAVAPAKPSADPFAEFAVASTETPQAPTGPQVRPYTARMQAQQQPAQYVHEILTNIPADLVEQGKNAVTGTYDLLSVLAKATGELGAGIGNFGREVVGLKPNASAGTENLKKVAGLPKAIVNYYAQYLDPEFRAKRVREHPVGMVLDMVPVAKGLEKGVPLAAKGVTKTASAVAHAPARVVDTLVGAVRGSPVAAAKGAMGHGPINTAVETAKAIRTATAPPEPPAVMPSAPAPPVAPVAEPVAVGRSMTPEAGAAAIKKAASIKSPQMLANEIGLAIKRAAKAANTTIEGEQFQAAVALVREGHSPAQAVLTIKRAVRGDTSAAAKLAEMLQGQGALSIDQMNAEIAGRIGNRSPKR